MTLAANKTLNQTMQASDVGGRSMGKFRQRLDETISYLIDYSNWLADGETISSVTGSFFPTTTPLILFAGLAVQNGDTVVFQIDNGKDGTRYIGSIHITTSTGQVKTDTFSVLIGMATEEGALPTADSMLSKVLSAYALTVERAADSTTAAINSAQSAISSQNYSLNAAASATNATNKANEASASAGVATTKASEALASASSASSSATTANTKAGEAATSATNAASSASSAANAATTAVQSQLANLVTLVANLATTTTNLTLQVNSLTP